MLNTTSIKLRFLISIIANILRAGLNFTGTLLIARALAPAGYGDFRFLLNSFIAICMLFDLGMVNAFFTFISSRSCHYKIFSIYYGWLVVQALFISLFIIILPQELLHKIWLEQPRGLVLLAFFVVFLQQQVWSSIGKVGESRRETIKVQGLNLIMGITFFAFAAIIFYFHWVSLQLIFTFLIIQHLIAMVIALTLYKKEENIYIEEPDFSQVFKEYWSYCKPLMVLALVTFLYSFLDGWLLQYYGGANQQGYYQVANQIISISLLMTTSILSIFWKEIAEAHSRLDIGRVYYLYKRVAQGLFICGAVLSGFFIPWSKEVVLLLLGKEYLPAWVVLALFFAYPIHQSLGQVNGALMLASSNTRSYALISIVTMLASMPIAYLMLSPNGLYLGGTGLALKMVLINIISVNLQGWLIARYYRWKFEWLYQLMGIGGMLILGYSVRKIILLLWPYPLTNDNYNIILIMLISLLVYGIFASFYIVKLPWLIGFSKHEMNLILNQCKLRFLTHKKCC